MNTECLICAEEVAIPSNVLVGEILACSACGQEHELQIIDGSQKLAMAPEIEEDWGE